MSVVLIRHAQKQHENGYRSAPYPFDPGLVGDPREKIVKTVETLLKENGPPDMIYVSPLLRTRETARMIQETLAEHGYDRVTVAEPAMGEYLGNWSSVIQSSQMTPDTLLYEPIVDDNIKQFEARVLKAFDEILERHSEQKIWVVTHGLVIKTCSKHLGARISAIPELGTVQIIDKKTWIRRGAYWVSQF